METRDNDGDAASSSILYDGGKRCTLFVVDFGEAMFDAPGEDSQRYFRLALQSVRNRVNLLCCTGSLNELVALLFINTANTNKDAENVDCMFVKRSVSVPDAEFVKELDSLLTSEDPRSNLGTILGTELGTCNWGELLFLCQRMLNYCGVILRRRQIFFFTVDGDPLLGDDNMLRSVRSYVSDLRARYTQLSVCLVDVAARSEEDEDHDDVNPFWHEIDSDVLQSSSFVRLQNEVMSKDVVMRTTASIPMRLGGSGFDSGGTNHDGLVIAVGVYCLIKEQSRPTAIPLDGDTNERLECRVHYVAEPGDNALAKHSEERFEGEINFAREIGGKTVVLDRTEMEGLRRLDDPG